MAQVSPRTGRKDSARTADKQVDTAKSAAAAKTDTATPKAKAAAPKADAAAPKASAATPKASAAASKATAESPKASAAVTRSEKGAPASKGNGAPRQGSRSRHPASTGISAEARYKMIAEVAYLLAERRSFEPGHEVEDWLEAEAEVNRRLAAG